MAYVDWLIKGPKIASCNCDYGCPCEFNGRPTRGLCEGLEAHRIEQGHFGEVPLDGLVVAARYRWPGPVHEGGGVAQGIIDERATEAQRAALLKILGGQEQEPTTVFNIYGSTVAKELEPVFAPIEFACDIAARTGRLVVPGVMRLTIEPIRNPVTGAPHRALIRLPEGFEFREAEVGSGTFRGEGDDLGFQNRDCYAALTHVAYGPYGIVEA
ncbi:MAG: hypothetical protein K0R41_2029 [Geminicoccaceae bacterium]|nr:hypothetical protein [Geminicoccaceae bacterium]